MAGVPHPLNVHLSTTKGRKEGHHGARGHVKKSGEDEGILAEQILISAMCDA
jgi:hypothetical protein